MSRSISRRSILATSGISAAALALAACGSSDGGKQAGGSGSAEGVLKVGVEGVYKPYNFHDDSGKLVGFEIDIVEAIAEKIGKKTQYVEAKWDSLLAGLDAGQYDLVMNNVAVTDERKKAFDLTVPYAQTQGRLGVPEGSDITSLADVKGRRAAQTTTSNWGQVMTDAGAEIVA
ncbi:MAG: transporter substrate-binding domain-containing protein, partial [Dermabacter sp.]|nr:transporter substrate-binding domain-containing protein [Dermabacter sp.]